MPKTNYGNLKATVPVEKDYEPGGPDVPRAFEEFTDSIGAGQGAGKILVVQETGSAAFKAMSGDVSINENGVTQIGNSKLATGMYQDGSVTAAKVADGAVTSRKLKPTVGIVEATSSGKAVGGAFEDVTSATLEITPDVASKIKITAVWHGQRLSGAGAIQGCMRLDGVDQTAAAPISYIPDVTGALAVMTQVYIFSLTTEKHSIKMRVKDASGGGGITYVASSTRFLYELIAS